MRLFLRVADPLLPRPLLPHGEDRGSHRCRTLLFLSFLSIHQRDRNHEKNVPAALNSQTHNSRRYFRWGPPSSGFSKASDAGQGLPASQSLPSGMAGWGGAVFQTEITEARPCRSDPRILLAGLGPTGLARTPGLASLVMRVVLTHCSGELGPGKQSCVATVLHSLVTQHQVTHKFNVI